MPEKNKITIKDLSIREKINQMIILGFKNLNSEFLNLHLGGFCLDKQESKESFAKIINSIKNNSKIKPFIGGDIEGYRNILENITKFKKFGEIKTKEQAYELGRQQAEIMKEIGFNLNLSPVVEDKDNVWPGRAFKGNIGEIKQKIVYYIKGLQENGILATAKHYPGKSMVQDPHVIQYKTEITKQDLDFFDIAIKENVAMIMIGHPIVFGEIDSNNKPSSISIEVISNLRKKFKGLIITDSIDMQGIKKSYKLNPEDIYVDLIKAGNDIILDIINEKDDYVYDKIMKKIEKFENAVKTTEISEQRIDESVKRILNVKGYEIID